ncbi:histidine phosphatase family protein [Methylobacterium sp. Leaf111]|uniref:histidine phosphatase family protein n=1 Tax=Methylobacterium sp. Leaf111 TaxID=1736257 RepID=UPI0009E9294A|nr:histidine phosphatase family protein [Methylobacterium sp. Leaf111]
MRLYVARHAECGKNLIGIPGGMGNSLTNRGIEQARDLAQYFAEANILAGAVGVCPPIQARETGEIIATRLGLPVEQRDELCSINLGVLTGIPISEARQLYPASSASMDLWRKGEIELSAVKIEGMEDPTKFFIRGLRYVLNVMQIKKEDLIVATTSIMILFENMHQMRGPAPGEGYVVREYDNAAVLVLDFSSAHKDWLLNQVNKYRVVL